MRYRLLIALVALLFVTGEQPAVACSCVQFTKPQVVERANVIFTGVPTRTASLFGINLGCNRSTADPVVFTFDVATVYKGDLPRTVEVRTAMGGASCGYEFETGKTYTVFATQADGRLETGLCTGTVGGAIAPAEYGLAPGRPPRP